ncbi:hypothetical protein SAMN06265365_101265 [Tistlia consotensis]|uniref:Uncharacterized protein n=1 Tax=Tistlia consotensis USBA 355 TaxID=560819 RepID=A0A1Y6B3P4_9PROT|nr:hypothetical protein [Tistlia consotensis]SME89892.1 hypothetical protein SAMN05428998_101263 [Tistlia consotensis USBA 355]SNR26386.1 hypothetical protein SAMN06265365_101265 [Tistlia consotensis]
MSSATGPLVADTITKLPPEAAGAVVVSGSHGGRYPGYLAAKAGLRAVILCDAGIGLDGAGVAALPYLDALGIAAATVSHLSCRIGDTGDMLARGRISRANAVAAACGVAPGQGTAEAAARLEAAPLVQADPPSLGESRSELPGSGPRRILLLDSAALVRPEDAGKIVVTGSHGGLVGGNPAMALRVDGFAAVFNDAGIGIDEAGIQRLPALDARGIAALTVAAATARIGEARSSFEQGIISAVNETARRLGGAVGVPARAVLLAWSEAAAVS